MRKQDNEEKMKQIESMNEIIQKQKVQIDLLFAKNVQLEEKTPGAPDEDPSEQETINKNNEELIQDINNVEHKMAIVSQSEREYDKEVNQTLKGIADKFKKPEAAGHHRQKQDSISSNLSEDHSVSSNP